MRILIFAAILGVGIGTQAAETPAAVQHDVREFKADMEQRLGEVQTRIEQLRKDSVEKGNEGGKRLSSQLENERSRLQAQLAKVKSESQQSWHDAKSNLARSLNELNLKVQKALND